MPCRKHRKAMPGGQTAKRPSGTRAGRRPAGRGSSVSN